MTYTEKNLPNKTKKPRAFKKVMPPPGKLLTKELKQEKPKVRYLKLQPVYRLSQSSFQVSSTPLKIVPGLRLHGNWLAEAGFAPSDYVSVTVMNELLIIRLAGQCQE